MGCGGSTYVNDYEQFNAICQAIMRRSIDKIELILSGLTKTILTMKYTIYHYLVIYAVNYTEEEMYKLCKILNKYKKFLNDMHTNAETEIAFQYTLAENKCVVSWHPAGIYEYDSATKINVQRKNCFSMNGLSALTLAYKLFTTTVLFEKPLIILIKLLNGTYDKEYKNELKMITVTEKQALNKCVICMDLAEQIMLMPCNHVCICEKCNNNITKCPICKTDVKSTQRVFIA
jgi:hypothetical protein